MVMRVPLVKSWVRLVLCYWLLMSAVIFLEIRYMDSGWAGLPGLLLTLPLSPFVVAGYILAHYAAEHGYDIHFTDYHAEYGFLVCAFLNAFILYPFYLLWSRRKESKFSEPPPPPDMGVHPASHRGASQDS